MEKPHHMRKTTQGRKKIEIKKIDQMNNRQVTFSKRRAGLFKKASELCILSGGEAAIIVCSPGGRVFSFGHQSVDAVVDKFVTGSTSSSSPPPNKLNEELNKRYVEISKELDAEKKRSLMIEEEVKVRGVGNGRGGLWWNDPIDGLSLVELEQKLVSMEELKRKLDMRADAMMMKSSTMPLTSMLGMNNQTQPAAADTGCPMANLDFDLRGGPY
ncbi:agamous-like MADS-box protein AGL62 [Cornus florida]|uniref:agamous-like MADS-box protein AGL62 n=1 Tax=Cornus florida TaxID=4283 RepID=UPI0028A1B62F|nr:agamous-like MADS-box protein AGL62 [Cornus florida]